MNNKNLSEIRISLLQAKQANEKCLNEINLLLTNSIDPLDGRPLDLKNAIELENNILSIKAIISSTSEILNGISKNIKNSPFSKAEFQKLDTFNININHIEQPFNININDIDEVIDLCLNKPVEKDKNTFLRRKHHKDSTTNKNLINQKESNINTQTYAQLEFEQNLKIRISNDYPEENIENIYHQIIKNPQIYSKIINKINLYHLEQIPYLYRHHKYIVLKFFSKERISCEDIIYKNFIPSIFSQYYAKNVQIKIIETGGELKISMTELTDKLREMFLNSSFGLDQIVITNYYIIEDVIMEMNKAPDTNFNKIKNISEYRENIKNLNSLRKLDHQNTINLI